MHPTMMILLMDAVRTERERTVRARLRRRPS